MKQYKAVLPKYTVNRIRDILKKSGITVSEECVNDERNLFFSVHLRIDSGKLRYLDISTNGKGKSMEYALASAYGELMERLQSRVLFSLRHSIPSGVSGLKYTFAPDERLLEGQNFEESLKLYTSLPEHVISFYKKKSEIGLPFADIFNKSLVFIPMRIVEHCCGSNGMCAGNTRHEAILQGICEIFERYALRLIYHQSLTPPLLHHNIKISDSLLNKIRRLERDEDCKIDIVDCSCGIGLPVYGLRIIRYKTMEYQFHLGADMVAEVGVERVLTELFQNRSHLPMHKFDVPYQLKLCNDLKLIEKERVKYSYRLNKVPLCVFSDKPSYVPMDLDPNRGRSDEEDLKIAFKLVKNIGKEIYIRDNSFMGFHAYTIYIPGMSELINVESTRWMEKSFEKSEKIPVLAHSIPTASSETLEDFISLISAFNEPDYLDWFTNDDVWGKGSSKFVVGIISAALSKWDYAIRQLRSLKEDCSNKQLKKLYAFYLDYCTLASAGIDTKEYLATIYGDELYQELSHVIQDARWKNIFDFTNCFNCINCKKIEYCALKDYIHLLRKLEKLNEDNILNQTYLFRLLD